MRYLIVLLCVITLFACHEKDKEPQIPVLGNFEGKVDLYSVSGELIKDKSNIEVYIDSMQLNAVTNSDGTFIFDNLPFKKYNLRFKGKDIEEFTTSFIHHPDSANVLVNISKVPIGLRVGSIAVFSNPYYIAPTIYKVDLSSDAKCEDLAVVIYFAKNNKNVSKDDFDFYKLAKSKKCDLMSEQVLGSYEIVVTDEDFRNVNFVSGKDFLDMRFYVVPKRAFTYFNAVLGKNQLIGHVSDSEIGVPPLYLPIVNRY